MKPKKYIVSLRDSNHTVIFTNSLKRTTAERKRVNKFEPTAQIVEVSSITMHQNDNTEPLNDLVVIDTTPFYTHQAFLREMMAIENALVAEMGMEYRQNNPVRY